MNVNLARHLGAVLRQTRSLQNDSRLVSVSRLYDTTPEDLWDALTNPERLRRWFQNVTGEQKEFALEDGTKLSVTGCEPNRRATMKWGAAQLEFSLHREHSHTRLTVEQAVPVSDAEWKRLGPGQFGLELEEAMLRLSIHLDSGTAVTKLAWSGWRVSANGHQFIQGATDAWAEAAVKANVDPIDAHQAATRVAELHSHQ